MRAVPQTAILGEREAGKIRDSIERVKAGLQQTVQGTAGFNLLLAGRSTIRLIASWPECSPGSKRLARIRRLPRVLTRSGPSKRDCE